MVSLRIASEIFNQLIGGNASAFIHYVSDNHSISGVRFLPVNEKDTLIIQIVISTVIGEDLINGDNTAHQKPHDTSDNHIMRSAVCYTIEFRQIVRLVETHVQFHRAFGGSKRSPGKHLKTQISR